MSFFLAVSVTILVLLFALSGVAIAQEEQYRTFQKAKLISFPDPVLPNEAKESGLGGKVTVFASVDKWGNVISAENLRGPDSICPDVVRPDVVELRKSAVAAAMKAKFSPAIGDGRAVPSEVELSFEFVRGIPKPEPEMTGDDEGARVANSLDDERADKRDKPSASNALPIKLPKTISGGVLDAPIKLSKPPYPPAARAVRASGSVRVQVLIEIDGTVFSAEAVTGHPLLLAAAEMAACGAKFQPTLLSGQPVKVSGIITYNFVP